MTFEIVHTTDYKYSVPASEAYIEARLTPSARKEQTVLQHAIDFNPPASTSNFTDYFGNQVTFYSMTLRHERLTVTNRMRVQTSTRATSSEVLEISVAETRQIFSSALSDVFDFLQPTAAVPIGGAATDWARKILRGDAPLGEAIDHLNRTIHAEFQYQPGSTEISTPLPVVWDSRTGVCQDFAHIMLSVLRTSGLPARYVCGYIESDPPPGTPTTRRNLIGSMATHAWVEVMVPGLNWVALDPTNDQWCGERHVSISSGRDFSDAAPLRGLFKGSGSQSMHVNVSMKRITGKP